jgi:hypothetical protein
MCQIQRHSRNENDSITNRKSTRYGKELETKEMKNKLEVEVDLRKSQEQLVKKKPVKKLETSDSLNPVFKKMKQEVLKKKQKFKVEE